MARRPWQTVAASAVGSLALAVAFGASAVGCTSSVAAATDAGTTTTVAMIGFERSTLLEASAPAGASDGPTAPTRTRTSGTAYFMRLQDANAANPVEHAARLIGAEIALPDPGQCELVEALRDDSIPLGTLGPVELFDVGDVTVEAGTVRETLAARAFPDLGDLVSGVVYTSREQFGRSLSDSGHYRVQLSGTTAFSPEALDATVPAPLRDVTIGGKAVEGPSLVIPRGDIPISWSDSGPDTVYVELRALDDGPIERVRCAFGQTNRGTVPGSMLPHGAHQRISIHRLHREEVASLGLHGGEIRFDDSVAVQVTLETPEPNAP